MSTVGLADMRFKLRFAEDGAAATGARSHGDRDTVHSVGGEWPKKDTQHASAPREWHGGRIWGGWCVCVFGQSLPRVISERGRGL
jgi:hypothetical protein